MRRGAGPESGGPGFEPWAWCAFGLGGVIAGLYLYLGMRPGGAGPVIAYSYGPLVLGAAAALGLLGALGWCLLRRPVLQRRRAAPLAVLAAAVWWCSFPIPYPSSHRSPSRVTFRLPFEGEARVLFGGERRPGRPNPLVLHPSRCFGLCFEPPGGEEADVLSPASGRIARLDRPEDERGPQRVVIEVGPGEFLVVEGLAPGSLAVSAGDELAPGDLLGRATSMLCLFLQDGPVVGRSEGIPLRFTDYLADGVPVETGLPEPPQRVRSAVAAPER